MCDVDVSETIVSLGISDDRITFYAFATMLHRSSYRRLPEELPKVLKALDVEGNGFVTEQVARQVLCSVACPMSPRRIDRVLLSAAGDRWDNLVEYGDWMIPLIVQC